MTLIRSTATDWASGPSVGPADHDPCPRCVEHGRHFAPVGDRPRITDPGRAADLLVPLLAGADRERCVALLLDTKHGVLARTTVSIGSVDHTFMAPREVYRDALLGNASAVVVAHNHPSGDPEPSRDDEAVTRRLAAAGDLLGVTLLDHLVIAGGRWVSLARRGTC